MIYLKSCPRCAGDLCDRHDSATGAYRQCFQCGHMSYGPLRKPTAKIAAAKKGA